MRLVLLLAILLLTADVAFAQRTLNPYPEWKRNPHPEHILAFALAQCFLPEKQHYNDCVEILSKPSTAISIARVVRYDCLDDPAYQACFVWWSILNHKQILQMSRDTVARSVEVWRALDDACETRPTPKGCAALKNR